MNKGNLTTEDTVITEVRRRINVATEGVIGSAIEVHRALGPGLLESSYEICLCHELQLRGLNFERQRAVAINYKGVSLDCDYRADLVVENLVLVELKAIQVVLAIHEAQLMSYLFSQQNAGGLVDQLQRAAPQARRNPAIGKS